MCVESLQVDHSVNWCLDFRPLLQHWKKQQGIYKSAEISLNLVAERMKRAYEANDLKYDTRSNAQYCEITYKVQPMHFGAVRI